MDFALVDAFMVSEIINNSGDEQYPGYNEKKSFKKSGLRVLSKLLNSKARYQEIHGSAQKGEKGGLIGQVSALNSQLFPENQLFFYSLVFFILHN